MNGGRDTRPHEVIFLNEIQDTTAATWHHKRVRLTGTICQLNLRARSCVLMDRNTSSSSPYVSIHVDLSSISVDIPLEMDLQCQFLGELRQQHDIDPFIEERGAGYAHQEGYYSQGRELEAGKGATGEAVEMEEENTAEHHQGTSSSSSSVEQNRYPTSQQSPPHSPSHSDQHQHHHHHATLRSLYLYATHCRVVPELDMVLLKQATLARRDFLATTVPTR